MTSSMAPGALDDAGLLPLEQGVLTENCGVSFVVVITKSDLCELCILAICVLHKFKSGFFLRSAHLYHLHKSNFHMFEPYSKLKNWYHLGELDMLPGNDLTDQQADRILVQVRRLCLQLGAALVYTSAKNVKNIQVLFLKFYWMVWKFTSFLLPRFYINMLCIGPMDFHSPALRSWSKEIQYLCLPVGMVKRK